MFGDGILLGQFEVVKKNNGINIPGSFWKELGYDINKESDNDVLQIAVAVLYSDDYDYLKIYKYSQIEEKVRKLNNAVEISESGLDYASKQFSRDFLISKIACTTNITDLRSQGYQLMLPDGVWDTIGIKNRDHIFVVGAVDHLEIYKSREKYLEALESNKARIKLLTK